VSRANEDEDEHKEREEKTPNNLLALELHW
jgi:hypothetical protein